MNKVYIVGNPNSGKTTLFNSLTKSSEHVGNWHGVTVEKTSKIIKIDDTEYEIVDLPGTYSLNAFSVEEQVTIDEIISNNGKILYLIDINNFNRSMLLALNLLIKNKNIKILINNYKKREKDDEILDIEYLKKILGCEIELINAKKLKPTKQLFDFTTRQTAFISMLKNNVENIYINNKKSKGENVCNELNKCDMCEDQNKKCGLIESGKLSGVDNAECEVVKLLYGYILKISNKVLKVKNEILGHSKLDKYLLKPYIFLPIFFLTMFLIVYFIFFVAGPSISDLFLTALYFVIQKPIMSIINLATNSKFVIALFEEGVFGGCFSVLGFLPQIALMYIFLSILENVGIISRMAFVMDGVLRKIGLNGKMVYTMLMGFGCSTTATITAKNMPDKNAQIKASLLTPFMSCSAKLPIYTTLAGALFGVKSIFVIFGLYFFGVAVAILLAIIFERTILPSTNNQFLLEFPPLRFSHIDEIYKSATLACKQFIVKVFGIIFASSMLLWLLNNLNIKFQYIAESGCSILYSFSSIISWALKPIGLNNPSIVCALLVGLVAKELILSSFAISNKVVDLTMLGASLITSSSVVNFDVASGVSFLIFTLLYFPCVSNFGVLIKEVGRKYALLGVGLQLGLAYMFSYFAYTLIAKGMANLLAVVLIIFVITISIKFIYKKIKNKNLCNNCLNCNKK
ncbi:MAG: ferrous iron transport protein B [Clostridia bacterium]|nr:ferrous iron transport protein B [Clostridia bacterium]